MNGLTADLNRGQTSGRDDRDVGLVLESIPEKMNEGAFAGACSTGNQQKRRLLLDPVNGCGESVIKLQPARGCIFLDLIEEQRHAGILSGFPDRRVATS